MIASPGASVDRKVSGTVKSSLIVLVSSSVVMTVPGLMRLPRLTRRRPDAAGERRADHRVVELRLRRRDARLVRLERRLDLVELRLRQRLRRIELAAAVVLAAALGDRGFRNGEFCPGLRPVELYEQVSAPHLLSLVEAHGGDQVRHLGRDVDRLVGVRGSQCLDSELQPLAAHRRDDHAHGRRACGRRPLRRQARQPCQLASRMLQRPRGWRPRFRA